MGATDRMQRAVAEKQTAERRAAAAEASLTRKDEALATARQQVEALGRWSVFSTLAL